MAKDTSTPILPKRFLPRGRGTTFPQPPDGPRGPDGMLLRDWFAGMALVGILGSRQGFLVDVGTDNAPGWAYDVADAMLAAREARP